VYVEYLNTIVVVVCMKLERPVTRTLCNITNRIYTLGTRDEHET